ncbi:sulfite exporter TauE/SafE family protein [Nevskia soli]|uniref:sulfite exporter TauE/SafE family protein n=1 Tax=Nevskia soli TaxID=418856 RepID=UPI0004A70218|nr:sulfite exporter TauE/SafE family protein [Nevskia soli]
MWIPGSVLSAPALFVAGVVSSAHCTLMCGALGVHQLRSVRALPPRSAMAWLYGGRLAGYSALGTVAGGLGQAMLRHLPDPMIGNVLQGAAALILVLIGLRYVFGARPAAACCRPPAPEHLSYLPPRISMLLRGMLWAALPCGILYSVLLLAAFTGSAAGGGILMAAFALGGTPMLVAAAWASLNRSAPNRSRRIAGYWMIAFGCAGLAATILMSSGTVPGWCRTALGAVS